MRPFMAVIQIIIYAGAIMVLFLFVVMLLNAPRRTCRRDRAPAARRPGRGGSAPCSRWCSLVELVWAFWRVASLREPVERPALRRPRRRARCGHRPRALHDHAFAFEVTSVLILVAMVGAVVLASEDGRGELVHAVAEPLTSCSRRVLFAIGTAGVFLRRNLITILLSIEIMLNAVNLTFVASAGTSARSTGRSSCSSS